MKKKAIVFLLASACITNANADTVGLYLGGQYWQTDISGKFGEVNDQIDHGLADEHQNSYFVAIEHPYPFLPNIRVARTMLDSSANALFERIYSADTETAHVDIQVDGMLNTNFNVNYVDYTLYFEVIDHDFISIDLGLTARDFGGNVSNKETTTTVTTTRDFIWDGPDHDDHDYHNIVEETQEVNSKSYKMNNIEPMIHVASKIQLPMADLGIFVQGDFSVNSDHSIYDYQAGVNYRISTNHLLELDLNFGYRTMKLTLDDVDGFYSDLDFKGAFFGLVAHF